MAIVVAGLFLEGDVFLELYASSGIYFRGNVARYLKYERHVLMRREWLPVARTGCSDEGWRRERKPQLRFERTIVYEQDQRHRAAGAEYGGCPLQAT